MSSKRKASKSASSSTEHGVLEAFARQMFAGGGAGAISRTLTAPVERVKVVLQVQAVSKVPETQQFKGIVDCFAGIYRQQGFLGYWRGNGLNVLRIIPNSAIKFSTYDHYKKIAFPEGEQKYRDNRKEKYLRKMVCGGLSGVTTLIPVYPLDLARTKLSADTQGRYRGVVHLMRTTVSTHGVLGLYTGLTISLCGIVPYLAISLATYDTLKEITMKKTQSYSQRPEQSTSILGMISFDNLPGKILLGSVSAIISQSFTYPMDTIRRHMQVSGGLGQRKRYGSTLECIREIYQRYGLKGFYRGLTANAARAAPQTGIEFAAFDILSGFLKQQNRENRSRQREVVLIDDSRGQSPAPSSPQSSTHRVVEPEPEADSEYESGPRRKGDTNRVQVKLERYYTKPQ